MKSGKTIFLFLCAFFIIGAIFLMEINFQSMATDSGFDTSYDSGGSSSGSSGGFSSSGGSGGFSSSGGSGSSSSSDMPPFGIVIFFEIFTTLFYTSFYSVLAAAINSLSKKEKKRVKRLKAMITVRVLAFIMIDVILWNQSDSVKELFVLFFAIDFMIMIIYICLLSRTQMYELAVLCSEVGNSNQFDNERIQDYIIPMSDAQIRTILPNFHKEKFQLDAYQIYYDVQMAWMNFDYEKLRTLVTDELYNTYFNQLQTLELKNQKNIMSDFELKQIDVVDIKVTNTVETIKAKLVVSFFDYIVRDGGIVVRGNKSRKVKMTYVLTFVSSYEKIESCPHCGAKLQNGETVCAYCQTNIQSVGHEMKLSKKEALRQEWEG